MKKEIEDLLEIDSQDQLKRAEELVARGVLARFEVKGENQFYYDPGEADSIEWGAMALDSLGKFRGIAQFLATDGKYDEAKIWKEAEQRLYKLFPKLAQSEHPR